MRRVIAGPQPPRAVLAAVESGELRNVTAAVNAGANLDAVGDRGIAFPNGGEQVRAMTLLAPP